MGGAATQTSETAAVSVQASLSSILLNDRQSRQQAGLLSFCYNLDMTSVIVLFLGLIIVISFAWGAVHGAPWVPTRRSDIKRVMALAGAKPGERIADLGCGTGRVLEAFARLGCRVCGWELALLPWLASRWRLRRFNEARIKYGNFWKADLREFDIVYAFLIPSTMNRLARKLYEELRPGTRIISYAFHLPGHTPTAIDRAPGRPPIYLYRI